MTARPTRDCTHPRVRHEHGTSHGYTSDGCRCDPCTQAHHERLITYRKDVVLGRNNYQADASRVTAHVRHLHTVWGLSALSIGTHSGVSYQTVQRLLDEDRPTVSRRVGAALLRLTIPSLPDDVLISSRGLHRRVQALACLGWAPAYVAGRAGYGNPTHLLTRDRVHLSTHRAVDGIYQELWATPRCASTLDEKRSISRAKNRAAREGWVPPAMWDDIDLDDAPAVAPVLALNNRGTNRARKAEDVVDLIAGGMAPAIVIDRLKLGSLADLARLLRETGRDDLALEAERAHQVWKDAA